MKEKEPTKLTGQNQGATTANVGAGLVPARISITTRNHPNCPCHNNYRTTHPSRGNHSNGARTKWDYKSSQRSKK